MKRISNLMCGLCLLFAACQSEDVFIDSPVASGEGNVNFMVSVPEVLETTRATLGKSSNSARGGITNVDFTKYDLRYQFHEGAYDDLIEKIMQKPITEMEELYNNRDIEK